MANLPYCEYCRSILFQDKRGNCEACGAPRDEGPLLRPVPASPRIAILKAPGRLSDVAIARIYQQWQDLFGPSCKLIVLENGMDIEFKD